MTVYFSHYIPYYSNIIALLFQLLGRAHKWTWEADQEKAFRDIKLYTDASDIVLGVSNKYNP
jgi:hypothetical protein